MASDRARSRARRRRSVVAFAFVAYILGAPLAASAEPTLSDRETARSLMEDGDAKRDKGELKSALKSYEAADAIMKVPTTGFEVGRTQAQLGLLLEARETLSRVARAPGKPGEPAPFEKARRAAEQLAGEVAARIPSVTVAIAGADPGATPQITFDGDAVPPPAASAPRKVNPGQHAVVVRVGSNEKREEFVVAEREAKTLTVDFTAPKPSRPVEPPPSNGGDGPSTGKLLMFGGFGLGVVGIGVGTVTGLLSISQVSDIKKSCIDNRCPPDKQSDIDAAKSLGTVSTIAFVAGGVGVAVGIVGVVMNGKTAPSPDAERSSGGVSKPVRVRADVGPRWAGLSGTF